MNTNFFQPGIFSDEWNQQIFNHHHREYGAFQLRNAYQKNVSKAMIISFITVMFLLLLYFIQLSEPVIIPVGGTTVTPVNPDLLDFPPKEKPKTTEPQKTVKESLLKAITKDTLAVDTTSFKKSNNNFSNGKGTDTSAQTTSTTTNGTGKKLETASGNSTPKKDSVVMWAPVMPEFPGGMEALNKFISKRMKTNSQWREDGVEGKVIYQFIIGTDGRMRDLKIFNDGVHFGLAEMNLAAFDNMPIWKPGKNGGQEVSVMFKIPVKFTKEQD